MLLVDFRLVLPYASDVRVLNVHYHHGRIRISHRRLGNLSRALRSAHFISTLSPTYSKGFLTILSPAFFQLITSQIALKYSAFLFWYCK